MQTFKASALQNFDCPNKMLDYIVEEIKIKKKIQIKQDTLPVPG